MYICDAAKRKVLFVRSKFKGMREETHVDNNDAKEEKKIERTRLASASKPSTTVDR